MIRDPKEGKLESLEPSREGTPDPHDFHDAALSKESLVFLLHIAHQFSATLDLPSTRVHVSRLALPILADLCILYHLEEDGLLYPLAAGYDSDSERRLQERLGQHVLDLDAVEGFPILIRESRSVFLPDLSAAEPSAMDEEQAKLIRDLGITSRVVVPLIANGHPQGALVLDRTDVQRPFTPEDLYLAEAYACQAALALDNARQYSQAMAAYEREKTIAETFQKSFIPQLPNRVSGLEVAHLYIPAQEQALVGGDFYDMFQLGSTHCSIVLGDVSGKGIEAAILTAMAKYNLRSLVTEFLYPATVLSKLSLLLAGELPPERFVSLFYGVYNQRTRQLLYANAGHEAALLESADGRLETLNPTGPILGLIPDTDYREETIILEPGASLLLYTDGITEARRGKKLLGQQGMTELFQASRGQSPPLRLQMLLEGARSYCKGTFRDDVALMLLHLPS